MNPQNLRRDRANSCFYAAISASSFFQQQRTYCFFSDRWFQEGRLCSIISLVSRAISFIVVIGLLLVALASYAAVPTPSTQFSVFLPEHGLNIGAIRAVHHDSKGYMWFGGMNGLVRYDGYKFEKYTSDPDNPHSLTNNNIYSIVEDSAQRIWIGTDLGFNRYVPEFNRFEQYHRQEKTSYLLSDDKTEYKNKLWVGTVKGIALFDPATGAWDEFENATPDVTGTQAFTVRSLALDRSGVLWSGTYGQGVSMFDVKTKKFTMAKKSKENDLDPDDVIHVIKEDLEGEIWIGSDKGLSRFNRSDLTRELFTMPDGKQPFLGIKVDEIFHQSKGIMWIGTKTGLYYVDRDKNILVKMVHSESENRSLAANEVKSIYQDAHGDLWVGTFPSGISFLNRNNLVFQTIKAADGGLSHASVLSLLEDSNKNIWIGTDGGGITLFENGQPNPVYFKANPDDPRDNRTINDNAVLSLAEGEDGNIWIGTWNGGVNVYDVNRREFEHFSADYTASGALRSNHIWKVFVDHANTLWAGSIGGGLFRFNRDTKEFTQFAHDDKNPSSINSNLVWSISETRKHELLLGTAHGFERFDPATGGFVHYVQSDNSTQSAQQGMIDITVTSIHEDGDGKIWLGTIGAGLIRFDLATMERKQYAEKDGLIAKNVVSIREDNSGNLWLGTHDGLIKFDKKYEKFVSYDGGDGIQGNQFNSNASFKFSDGELAFGGTKGLTRFLPDQVKSNEVVPPVVLVDFKVMNKPVDIFDSVAPFTRVIEYAEKVTLNHQQKMFMITFAGLSYRNSQKNQYAYKLDGFDEEWNEVGSMRTATYTNLDPGSYTFRVKAANNDGVWNPAEKTLAIIILPAPWKTWWAYCLYALSGLVIILILMSWQKRRMAREWRVLK